MSAVAPGDEITRTYDPYSERATHLGTMFEEGKPVNVDGHQCVVVTHQLRGGKLRVTFRVIEPAPDPSPSLPRYKTKMVLPHLVAQALNEQAEQGWSLVTACAVDGQIQLILFRYEHAS